MSETSDEWRDIAPLDSLERARALAVQLDDCQIGLFLVDGQVFAIDNLCTHGNACLTEGAVEGHVVECPLHAGLVDLRSGKALGAPVTRDSRVYAVRVELGRVLVQVPTVAG